ncbi:MAG: ECF transporter S component [Oscillospiraceae bacterium]|nr:ECF transporter S component [Oscillospiraceae bacterium]
MATKNRSRIRKITTIALFSAISTILMYIEMPLPFMPPFLKLDISAVPIMIGSFAFGPVEALCMAFIKSCVHALSTTTGGVGELADFLITGSFALTAGLIYRKTKTKKSAILACVFSVFVIVVVGCLANYFVLLPFYSNMMPLEAIYEMCNKVNPLITGKSTYIVFGVAPFNLIKGAIVSALTFLTYKKMSGFLKKHTV